MATNGAQYVAPIVDHLQALEYVQVMDVPDDVFRALAEAMDVCPLHVCDAQICRDDEEEECKAFVL